MLAGLSIQPKAGASWARDVAQAASVGIATPSLQPLWRPLQLQEWPWTLALALLGVAFVFSFLLTRLLHRRKRVMLLLPLWGSLCLKCVMIKARHARVRISVHLSSCNQRLLHAQRPRTREAGRPPFVCVRPRTTQQRQQQQPIRNNPQRPMSPPPASHQRPGGDPVMPMQQRGAAGVAARMTPPRHHERRPPRNLMVAAAA